MTSKTRRLFIAACICITALSVIAASEKSEAANKSSDFQYSSSGKGIAIDKYIGKSKKVVIPEKIDGKKVVRISENAFKKKNIVSVKIPDTVTAIESLAFKDCENLKSVKLSKALTEIDDRTFFRCTSLEEVLLPESVVSIQGEAFKYCRNLKSINLDKVKEIEHGAFLGNNSLSGTIYLSNIEKIDNRAFQGCSKIERVVFSERLSMLGYRAVYPETDIIQGETGYSPFSGCSSITEFEIPEGNTNFKTVDGIIYGKSGEWLIAYPAGKTGVFTVPESVKGIGPKSFANSKVSEVIIGSNVTELGIKAFKASSITTIKFPKFSNDTKIRTGCFDSCNELVSVSFADGTVSSKNATFRYCKKLTEIYFPETMTTLSDGMFIGCTSLKKVTLPRAVTVLPEQIFSSCTALNDIKFENVKEIRKNAFENCTAFSGTLTLNADSIEYDAFKNCTGITEVVFNRPIELMGHGGVYTGNPFSGCTEIERFVTNAAGKCVSNGGALYSADMDKLIAYPAKKTGEVIIPLGVKEVASYAFSASKATALKFPEGLIKLNPEAITDAAVERIDFPASIESVGKTRFNPLFDNCDRLSEINIAKGNPYYDSHNGVLYGINNYNIAGSEDRYMLLKYPAAKKGKKYTIKKCDNIAEGAFADCRYLKKVYFESDKLYRIEGNVFSNVKNVTIYLPKVISKLGNANGTYNGIFTRFYIFDGTCKKSTIYAKRGRKYTDRINTTGSDVYKVKLY